MAQGQGSGAVPRGDASERLAALPRWWLRELRGLVPESLKARTVAAPAAFGCSLFADGRVAFARLAHAASPLPGTSEAVTPSDLFGAQVAAAMTGTARRSVRLSVPSSLCLIRHTRLPARALPHAGAILKGEIEALMPPAASDLLFDWYVEAEDAETGALDLVQVVLSRARIAEIAERLGCAGLTLTRLTVDEAEGRALPVDLMNGRDPTLRAFLARLPFRAKAGVALALLLVAATPLVVAARQETALTTLSDARVAAMPAAAATRSVAAVADELESFGRRPPLAFLLDEIARRLPSNVHLTRLQFADGQVSLATQGGDAQAARAALAQSPFFASVATGDETAGTLVLTLAPPGVRAEAPDAATAGAGT